MKYVKNIMLMLAVALFAACETDVDTPQIASPDKFVAPVIGQCGDVIVNLDNSKAETVIYTWEKADFGLPVQVLYSLYLTDGTNTALLGTSSGTYLSVTKGDLNGIVMNGLGVAANQTVTIQAYVTARLSGSTDYKEVSSELSNSFKVTTFAAPLKSLYAVGIFNGWKEGEAAEFWETDGGTNTYVTMVNLTDDGTGFSGFKILTERSWNGEGNWGYDAFTVGPNITSSSDGNLVLPAGIWQLTVNRTVMSIEAKSIGSFIGLIGSFNDWGGDVIFNYDHLTSSWRTEPVTLDAGAEVKIRANGGWDVNWGTSADSNSQVISGGINLNGGDNIKVPAAGTYVVVLHANRTPFVLEFVAQ